MRSFLLVIVLFSAVANAGTDQVMAISRNNATNFKDRVLAYCISEAYKNSPAGEDAKKTAGVFLDWTYYDLDADSETDALITKYLRRDYSTPIEGYSEAEFALLKCLDMYHSQELNELVLKRVPHPDWVADKPVKNERE